MPLIPFTQVSAAGVPLDALMEDVVASGYGVAGHPLAEASLVVAAASDGPLVVRWNLHPTQGYEQAKDRYAPFDKLVDEDRPTRNALAKLARESLASRRDVFIIANNKAEGSAPLSLFALAKGILGRT